MVFEVNLYDQVPHYGKEDPNWGGPAVCQMAMDGYPSGATSCQIDQTVIWNYIQANNQEGGTGPWGSGWWSDPYAVTKVLNDLCPPTGHWIDVSDVDKEKVLYTLLRWMARYRYPAPICLGASDNWVLLCYYRTSDDPRVVTNPDLLRIGYRDASPNVLRVDVPGADFLVGSHYWGLPCNDFACGQIWKNKYVGVGEPPEERGRIRVERISRIGERLISPEDAVSIARKFLREYSRNRSEFLLKRLIGVQAWQPMLVRELPLKQAKMETEEDVRYYLVPFGNKYEVDEAGTGLARLSVLVNAYTGRFEGLTVFSRPIHYLQKRDALRIARKSMPLMVSDIDRIEAELVFQPRHPDVTKSLPAWRFAVKEKELFITQGGLVLGTLIYITYKGA